MPAVGAAIFSLYPLSVAFWAGDSPLIFASGAALGCAAACAGFCARRYRALLARGVGGNSLARDSAGRMAVMAV